MDMAKDTFDVTCKGSTLRPSQRTASSIHSRWEHAPALIANSHFLFANFDILECGVSN